MITYEGPIISIEPMAYVEFVPIARVTSQTSNGSVLRRTSANMPRVRWCASHSVLCLLVGVCSFWIVTVGADCWYDEDRHEEGKEVPTAEPCLNCTCSRGVLLCYLRMCPKLPNPPPPGCILLHRYRTCCPELICAEFSGGGNDLEARSDTDVELDMTFDRTILENACIANGSIYGPGSAMHSSSLCEYCYCLGGKQICVKPKCLLPIEGCTPMYDPTNCCPIQYNCTSSQSTTTSSTTTENPKELDLRDGCLVDGVHHPEGGKVLGVGHSVCDNCYCMKGLLRCEPLSCAPPLLGCTPVIKPGECCAASYNCSGAIEIQPEPNYGLFPIVSKEYAKLRKEVNQKRPLNTQGVVTVAPFYVLAESLHQSTTKHRSPGTFGTTRHFTGVSINPSTTKPFYYNSMSKKHNDSKYSTRIQADNREGFPGIYYATTNYEFQNTNYKRVYSTTTKPKPTNPITFKTVNAITTTNYKEERTKSPDQLDMIYDIIDWIEDGRLNRKVDKETTSIDISTTDNSTTTELSEMSETTSDTISTIKSFTENLIGTETDSYDQSSEAENIMTTENAITSTPDSTPNISYPITLRTILNSTDCIKDKEDLLNLLESNGIEVTTLLPVDASEINKLAELRRTGYEDVYTTESEEYSTETSTEDDVTEVDLVSRVNVASATLRNIPDISNVPNVQPDIETILNITKHKSEDYEYDYNEPTLPPSLPNLRIIPFVAADALDAKKDALSKGNLIYTQERVTDTSFGYTNLFSPPIETEGGFVPKEPPILDNFYENAVTASSITIAPKLNNAHCVNQQGQEIAHGQSVPSESSCVTCTCFYGNIVCQKPTCPIPRPGCRKSSIQDLTLCCPHYVCDDEAPTVVLDRLDGTSNNAPEIVTVAERVVSPDPFRDVIRTEPAPNLQSLIVDMMPFLARQTTTPLPQIVTEKPTQQTTPKNVKENDNKTDEGFSLDKVLQLLFSGDNEEKTETSTNKIQTTVSKPADRLSTVLATLAPSVNDKLYLTESITENHKPNSNHPNSVDSSGVGLLKLAGCNIYGRMYRVGRIISELSGPCLECKCTEIGVQCKALKC